MSHDIRLNNKVYQRLFLAKRKKEIQDGCSYSYGEYIYELLGGDILDVMNQDKRYKNKGAKCRPKKKDRNNAKH